MKKILLSLVVLATALSASAQIQRMVVVEEFTGTGCPWCTRGLAGMDWLKATYEDKCIGIALHQYNSSDPMYYTKYANLGINSFPNSLVSRYAEADPYFGFDYGSTRIFDAVDEIAALETHAYVESLSAVYVDENQKKATVTAKVNFDADGDYSLAFVLTADSLTGEGSAWQQTNNYAGYTPNAANITPDEPLAMFCSGGEFGTTYVNGYKFNDVAVSSTYNANGENLLDELDPAVAGVSQERTYTLTLPTKSMMVKAMRKDLIFATALIIDNTDGTIANAARVRVINADDPTGISTTSKEATAVAFFNAEGKAVSAPQKGLNIVKMSDGTVKKVMY